MAGFPQPGTLGGSPAGDFWSEFGRTKRFGSVLLGCLVGSSPSLKVAVVWSKLPISHVMVPLLTLIVAYAVNA